MKRNSKGMAFFCKVMLSFITVIMLAVLPFFPSMTATAEEVEDYLPESFSAEIQEREIKFPAPDIPETWAYSITLKNEKDETIAENVGGYTFSAAGEYRLIYKIHKAGSVVDFIEETVIFNVVDSIAPTIRTDGYDIEYFVGATLTVLTGVVTDNVDKNLTANVQLLKGEQEQQIVNGEFTFQETGAYSLIYTATDLSGNKTTLTYDFTVLAKNVSSSVDTEEKGCGSNIFAGGAGGALLTGVAAFAVLLKKNKEK